ncbi:predicted protein [Histoplasma capsulatum H143]|uniref:Uncharacterized protein n=1 Tax=Ajellomyces capsulatus (strain H143) TaxID=544712 RepID=C6HMN2_AJECH|nr:predicted protein [Histoplasma capsulatum H143]
MSDGGAKVNEYTWKRKDTAKEMQYVEHIRNVVQGLTRKVLRPRRGEGHLGFKTISTLQGRNCMVVGMQGGHARLAKYFVVHRLFLDTISLKCTAWFMARIIYFTSQALHMADGKSKSPHLVFAFGSGTSVGDVKNCPAASANG